MAISISSRPDLHAYHSSELIFGTYNVTPSLLLCTSTEIVFGKYVKGAWVDSAFARDPANGLLNYGWTSVVQLGGFCNQAGATFSPSVLLDFTCGALATLSAIQAQLAALLSTASSIRTMSSFMIFGFLHITKFVFGKYYHLLIGIFVYTFLCP